MPDPDVRANTPATVVPGESPGGALDYFDQNQLTAGEETMPRSLVLSGAAGSGSGNLRLTYFTARKSETITQVRMWTGGTAAGATPTLVRIGLYTVATDGALALVAATASDTALFAATNTSYTKAFAAPYGKVAGQRYAVGALIVTGAAAPSFMGNSVWASASAEVSAAPRLTGLVSSQADLPASVAGAAVSANGQYHYAVLLP